MTGVSAITEGRVGQSREVACKVQKHVKSGKRTVDKNHPEQHLKCQQVLSVLLTFIGRSVILSVCRFHPLLLFP